MNGTMSRCFMQTEEIEDLEEERLPWIEEVQGRARDGAAKAITQDCLASLPLPATPFGGKRNVAVFFYPFVPMSGSPSFRVFEPVIAVTVDATKMEALEVRQLRSPVDVNTEPALSLDKNEAARNISLADLDSLNFEFLVLYSDVLEQYPRNDLDEDEKKRLRRFQDLFSFLVPSGLLPFYERLNPDFFSWLEAITEKSLTPLETPPLRRSEEDLADEQEVSAEGVSQPAKIELTDEIIEGILNELKLTPTVLSPLADLQPRPNKIGLSPLLYKFPDWPPENWWRIFQTLCKPEWEIAVVFSNEEFAAKTSLFDGHDPDRAYWIRCTQQDASLTDTTAGVGKRERLISFPHDPADLKESVMTGLQSSSISIADQTADKFTPEEFMTVLALSDFFADDLAPYPAKMTKSFAADDLIKVWLAADEATASGWCAMAKLVSPVLLPDPKTGIIEGLELLKAEEFIRQETDGLEAAPKLRALLRPLRRPSAFASVQVNHYGSEATTIQGFSAIRTDNQIWLWEAAETVEFKEPSEKMNLNMFQVTDRQLASVLDSFLGTGEGSE